MLEEDAAVDEELQGGVGAIDKGVRYSPNLILVQHVRPKLLQKGEWLPGNNLGDQKRSSL